MRYVQIDKNGICYAVSNLLGDVEETELFFKISDDIEPLKKKYINGNWIEVEQPIVEKQISDRELLEEIYLNQELNKITGGL